MPGIFYCPVSRVEVDQDNIVLTSRANDDNRIRFDVDLSADLSRQVQADMQDLVGIGHDGREGGCKFQLDARTASCQLWSKQSRGCLQNAVDVNLGEPGGSLPSERKQAGNQSGGAANLLADLRRL